jgi:hypothetical protein
MVLTCLSFPHHYDKEGVVYFEEQRTTISNEFGGTLGCNMSMRMLVGSERDMANLSQLEW